LDALEQIELIRKLSEAGREAFFGDPLTQSAMLHRLALLGEACRGVWREVREAHVEIPRDQIIAFRNVIMHQYFGLDLELVWVIITEYVARLGGAIESVLRSLPA
jgi:uncharacterized protein with HEPN domain